MSKNTRQCLGVYVGLAMVLILAGHPAVSRVVADPARVGVAIESIPLYSQDMLYDGAGRRIFASISADIGSTSSSIAVIDPATATISTTVEVGLGPRALALSDDGRYLYVGVDGLGAIRRVDLATLTPDLLISLGQGACGRRTAADMEVLRGQPRSIAVVLRNWGCNTYLEGVVIFDDATPRPVVVPGEQGPNAIEASPDPNVLVGHNTHTFELRLMTVLTNGVVISPTAPINAMLGNMVFDEPSGRIYGSSGLVLNPLTGQHVGWLPFRGPVAPPTASGRVYSVGLSYDDPQRPVLRAFDTTSLTLIHEWTLSFRELSMDEVVMTGPDRLTIRAGGNVFLARFVELGQQLYVPTVERGCGRGICGRVTEGGLAAANIDVELRFFNGSSWVSGGTTRTAADGGYEFLSAPTLGPGQALYVRYRNEAGTPGRLWAWSTRLLTSYTAFTSVPLGVFDIGDIVLGSPPSGSRASLPQTFQWTRRHAQPIDSYVFVLYDFDDGDPLLVSPALGYVSSYMLSGFPSGFAPNTPYAWEVWALNSDGGIGVSRLAHAIAFETAGLTVGERGGDLPTSVDAYDRLADLARP